MNKRELDKIIKKHSRRFIYGCKGCVVVKLFSFFGESQSVIIKKSLE